MTDDVKDFDQNVLADFRIRKDSYFGIADWEMLAAKYKVKVAFTEIFRLPYLKDFDYLIPDEKNKSFRQSLDKSDSFVFLIPKNLVSLNYNISFNPNGPSHLPKVGNFNEAKPGFYIIDYSRTRAALINQPSDPAVLLGAFLWAEKKIMLNEKLSFSTKEKRAVWIVESGGVNLFCKALPKRLLSGIIMPMERS